MASMMRVSDPEVFWPDHRQWLQDRGYKLRWRYMPGRTPSLKGIDERAEDCEDGSKPVVCSCGTLSVFATHPHL